MDTAQHSSHNSSLPIAAMDILLAVPRFAQRAGAFAFYHMPDAMDGFTGKLFNGGSVIADATGQQTANSTITMSHYIYNTCFINVPNFGYAAAMSFIIFIMVAVLAFINLKVGDTRD